MFLKKTRTTCFGKTTSIRRCSTITTQRKLTKENYSELYKNIINLLQIKNPKKIVPSDYNKPISGICGDMIVEIHAEKALILSEEECIKLHQNLMLTKQQLIESNNFTEYNQLFFNAIEIFVEHLHAKDEMKLQLENELKLKDEQIKNLKHNDEEQIKNLKADYESVAIIISGTILLIILGCIS